RCPHPIVPTPGISPNQFADRMKMKIVAKNQNVRLTRCGPMTPSRKSYSPATSHSRRFWAPLGTRFMSRVAIRAKMIKATATIQVTTMELEIGKPSGRAISTAPCDKPCSSEFAANAMPAPIAMTTPDWRSCFGIATLMILYCFGKTDAVGGQNDVVYTESKVIQSCRPRRKIDPRDDRPHR